MYEGSAPFYDRLLAKRDYRGASERLVELAGKVLPAATTLLDVACGTGRHVEHLRRHFRATGADLSPQMLAVARIRCPDIQFQVCDFHNFDLGRRFDIVTCLFGSIGHAYSLDRLERAIGCMARHLSERGVLIIEPWITPERFIEGKVVLDTVDDPDLKVARAYVSRREGRRSVYDIEYLVATAAGVTHFTEHEELGLFTREEYRGAMESAGLRVIHEDSQGPFGYGLYIGARVP